MIENVFRNRKYHVLKNLTFGIVWSVGVEIIRRKMLRIVIAVFLRIPDSENRNLTRTGEKIARVIPGAIRDNRDGILSKKPVYP